MTGTIISINATRTHILADKKLWYMVSIRMMTIRYAGTNGKVFMLLFTINSSIGKTNN
jgi:hypothetical protein